MNVSNRILAGIIISAAVLLNIACPSGSNSTQTSSPTPTTTPTPPVTRGCPAGTKACGDACIPENQVCGGEEL